MALNKFAYSRLTVKVSAWSFRRRPQGAQFTLQGLRQQGSVFGYRGGGGVGYGVVAKGGWALLKFCRPADSAPTGTNATLTHAVPEGADLQGPA